MIAVGAGLVPAPFVPLLAGTPHTMAATTQLEGALEQISWAADALEGLRREADEQNGRIFPILAEAYISHIRAMTAETRASVDALRPDARKNT